MSFYSLTYFVHQFIYKAFVQMRKIVWQILDATDKVIVKKYFSEGKNVQ